MGPSPQSAWQCRSWRPAAAISLPPFTPSRPIVADHSVGRLRPLANGEGLGKSLSQLQARHRDLRWGRQRLGSIEEKVALANRVGHGWPDIVFSDEQNDVQKLGYPPFNFPAVLNNGLVPSSVLKNYAAGALSPCMVGKKLECLRNDLAFDVLWVNVPLMKQFGYTVPTTWQQWQAIGENVAANHPGYIIGTARQLL